MNWVRFSIDKRNIYQRVVRSAYADSLQRYTLKAPDHRVTMHSGANTAPPARVISVSSSLESGWVDVAAAYQPKALLIPLTTPIDPADETWFVECDCSEEDFEQLVASSPTGRIEVHGPRLSTGQVQALVAMMVLVMCAAGAIIRFHTETSAPLADFLAYVLPFAAALVVGARLYIGESISDLVTYELSLVLLLIGFLCNAYVHPCGSVVIVIACFLVAATCTGILIRRIYRNRRPEFGFSAFFAGFTPWLLVTLVVSLGIIIYVFWGDFFVITDGHRMCPAVPRG